jgi:hypothetical protein
MQVNTQVTIWSDNAELITAVGSSIKEQVVLTVKISIFCVCIVLCTPAYFVCPLLILHMRGKLDQYKQNVDAVKWRSQQIINRRDDPGWRIKFVKRIYNGYRAEAFYNGNGAPNHGFIGHGATPDNAMDDALDSCARSGLLISRFYRRPLHIDQSTRWQKNS